jgi:hypothetical protein
MGGSSFCLKACDPAGPNAARFCEHVYDRIGCAYNAPNSAPTGVFQSCDGDNQDFPGVYTTNGEVMTYRQPPESLGPITTIPYTARIPASSNCQTFQSASLYTALPSVTTSGAATTTASPGSAGASATRSGVPAATNGASPRALTSLASLAAVTFVVTFFA